MEASPLLKWNSGKKRRRVLECSGKKQSSNGQFNGGSHLFFLFFFLFILSFLFSFSFFLFLFPFPSFLPFPFLFFLFPFLRKTYSGSHPARCTCNFLKSHPSTTSRRPSDSPSCWWRTWIGPCMLVQKCKLVILWQGPPTGKPESGCPLPNGLKLLYCN